MNFAEWVAWLCFGAAGLMFWGIRRREAAERGELRASTLALTRFRDHEEAVANEVLDLLDQVEWAEPAETKFRRALVSHLSDRGVPCRTEVTVGLVTQVDVVAQTAVGPVYITLKRGLGNQQRLTLQGEVEDIIAHECERKFDGATVVVLVGVESKGLEKQTTQAAILSRWLEHKQSAWMEEILDDELGDQLGVPSGSYPLIRFELLFTSIEGNGAAESLCDALAREEDRLSVFCDEVQLLTRA